jgi:hypothetical protein
MSDSNEYEVRESGDEPGKSAGAVSAEPKLSDGLKRFMVGLASDVGKLTDFMLDQKKAFQEAGLSEEQQQILLSGDQGRIYAALKDLPVPPAAPAPPPAQMPTVVAAMNLQGQGAAAPAAPQQQAPGQLPPYYVLQQPQGQVQQAQAPMQAVPTYQVQQAQAPMQAVPTYQVQPQQIYYVQWPNWPNWPPAAQ